MMPVPIKSVSAKEVRGDLRAKLDNGNLLIPERVAVVLAGWGIRTAVDLLSILQAFPSAVADELGWEPGDVAKALAVLKTQLRGRVDDSILNPPRHLEPVYGAFPPPEAKRKPH
jgi:hypothetical protein